MRKHNKKYNQIATTGKDLFWKHGIKRITIEEICKEAGVSKMTFYKFFTNKTDLALQIIDDIYSDSIEQYNEIMSRNIPYKEKITELTHLKLKWTDHISKEFLGDWMGMYEEESGYLHKKVSEQLDMMLNDFKKAQQKGDIRSDIKPEFISYYLNNLINLVNDPQLSSLYPDPQEMIMELMNFFFYGVLPRSK